PRPGRGGAAPPGALRPGRWGGRARARPRSGARPGALAQPAGPGPHRGHAGPRGRPARPRRSHPARRAPGLDPSRAGLGAAAGAAGERPRSPVTDAAAPPAGAATPAARAGSAATRTVAVTVPDWPLLAALDRHQRRREAASGADAPPTLDLAVDPVLLLDQHRVTHAGAAAREAGAVPGMKRRAARAACPDVLVLEADHEHDSALFEIGRASR